MPSNETSKNMLRVLSRKLRKLEVTLVNSFKDIVDDFRVSMQDIAETMTEDIDLSWSPPMYFETPNIDGATISIGDLGKLGTDDDMYFMMCFAGGTSGGTSLNFSIWSFKDSKPVCVTFGEKFQNIRTCTLVSWTNGYFTIFTNTSSQGSIDYIVGRVENNDGQTVINWGDLQTWSDLPQSQMATRLRSVAFDDDTGRFTLTMVAKDDLDAGVQVLAGKVSFEHKQIDQWGPMYQFGSNVTLSNYNMVDICSAGGGPKYFSFFLISQTQNGIVYQKFIVQGSLLTITFDDQKIGEQTNLNVAGSIPTLTNIGTTDSTILLSYSNQDTRNTTYIMGTIKNQEYYAGEIVIKEDYKIEFPNFETNTCAHMIGDTVVVATFIDEQRSSIGMRCSQLL